MQMLVWRGREGQRSEDLHEGKGLELVLGYQEKDLGEGKGVMDTQIRREALCVLGEGLKMRNLSAPYSSFLCKYRNLGWVSEPSLPFIRTGDCAPPLFPT